MRPIFIRYVSEYLDNATAEATRADARIRRSSDSTAAAVARNSRVMQAAQRRFAESAKRSGERVRTGSFNDAEVSRFVRAITIANNGVQRFGQTSKGAGNEIRRLNQSFMAFRNIVYGLKLPALATGIAALTQAAGVAAGAVTALAGALGPLAGALVAIPAAAGLAAQGIFTFKTAMMGLGDVLTAHNQLQLSSGTASKKAAKDMEAAAEQIRNAQDRLDAANRKAKEAQEAITRARQEARRELVDLALAAEGSANAELRAQLALKQARQDAARAAVDPTATSTDRESAALAVVEAETALKEAQVERVRAVKGAQEADRKGVEQSDRVREALQDRKDAVKDVKDAERDLAKARKDAKAKEDDAGGGSAADRYKQLYDRLSKEGKQFADYWTKTIQPIVQQELVPAAGRKFFPQLIEGIEGARKNLPTLKQALEDTGGALGYAAKQVGKFLGSEAFGSAFRSVTKTGVGIIRQLADSFRRAGPGIAAFIKAAQPFVRWLGKIAGAGLEALGAMGKVGAATGRTKRFFDDVKNTLKIVGHLLWDFGGAMKNIASIGRRELGDALLKSLAKTTANFKAFTESTSGQNKIAQWFRDIRPAAYAIANLIREITKALVRAAAQPGFAKLIDQLRTQLLPALERMLETTTAAFGPALVSLITSLLTLFAALSGPMEVVLNGLALMAEAFAFILDKTPGLKTIVTVLAGMAFAWKALKFTAAITGVSSLIRLLGRLQAEYVKTATAAGKSQAAAAAAASKSAASARAAGVGSATPVVAGAGARATVVPTAAAAAAATTAQGAGVRSAVPAGSTGTPMIVPTRAAADATARAERGAAAARQANTAGERAAARQRRTRRVMGAGAGLGTAAILGSALIPQGTKVAGQDAGQVLGNVGVAALLASMLPLTKAMDAAGKVASRFKGVMQGLALGLKAIGPIVLGLQATIGRFVVLTVLPLLAPLAAPIAIGVAIAALVATVYIFREQIASAIMWVVGKVEDGLGAIADFFTEHQRFIKAVAVVLFSPLIVGITVANAAVKVGLKVMSAVFSTAFDVIKSIVRVAISVVSNLVRLWMLQLKVMITAGVKALEIAWAVIKTILVTPVRAGFNAVASLFTGIAGRLSGPISSALGVLGKLWGGIKSTLLDPVKDAVRSIGKFLGGAGEGVYKGALSIGKSIVHGIGAALSAVGGLAKNVAKAIFRKIDEGLPDSLPTPGPDIPLPKNPLKDIGLYAGGGWIVPGPSDRDGTLALLSGDEAVITGPGQRMMEAMAPGVLDAVVAGQAPHFREGGYIDSARIPRYRKGKGASEVAKYDRIYPEHGLNERGGKIHFDKLITRKIAEWAGLNPGRAKQAAEISQVESAGFYPGIRGDDPGGTKGMGLWQITRGVQGALGKSWIDSRGGDRGMRNPLRNAEVMALMSRNGASWSQWYGDQALQPYDPDTKSALGRDGGSSSSRSSGSKKKPKKKKSPAARTATPAEQKKVYNLPTGAERRLALRGGAYEGAAVNALAAARDGASRRQLLDAMLATIRGNLGSNVTSVSASSAAELVGEATIKRNTKANSTTKPSRKPLKTAAKTAKGKDYEKRLAAIRAFATRVDAKQIPYGADGHASGWKLASREDCSSSVSKLLHAGGYLDNVQTTVNMSNGLMPGRGKVVTLHNRPLPGNAGHVLAQIGSAYWGTSRSNPGGGPGWINPKPSPSYLATMPQKLHPGGLRRGGFVRPRRFRAGGFFKGGQSGGAVGYFQRQIAERQAASAATAKSLSGETVRRDSDGSKTFDMLTTLSNQVAVAGQGQLQSLRNALQKTLKALLNKKQTVGVQRQVAAIQGALALVDTAAGAFFAGIFKRIDETREALDARKTAVDQFMRVANIDSGSSQGLQIGADLIDQQMNALGQTRLAAIAEARKARSMGLTDVADQIDASIKEMTGELVELAVSRVEAIRAVAAKAAAEAVEAAQLRETIGSSFDPQALTGLGGNLGLQMLQTKQELAQTGKEITPEVTRAANEEQAAYITAEILPGLQNTLARLQDEQRLAVSQGDEGLAKSKAVEIAEKQLAILQAQLTAQKLVVENTAETTEALKDFGGSLAFEFQGQTFTDLYNVGVGA